MTIYITGDIHGSSANVRERIAQIENPKEDDVIIVCGDAGLEYGSQIQGSAKKEMKKFQGTWLILRGNHDTRYWRDHTELINNEGIAPIGNWHFEDKFGDFTLVQNKYPNIHYIRDDGGIYSIGQYEFLCVPGAYSVDKFYRLTNHLSYEYEEQLSYTEGMRLHELAIFNANDIDYVIAHTFPKRIESKLKYLFLDCIDQKKVDKNTEKWLDVIMGEVSHGKKFKHFFGGHYHDDKELEDNYTLLYHTVVKLEDYNNGKEV